MKMELMKSDLLFCAGRNVSEYVFLPILLNENGIDEK